MQRYSPHNGRVESMIEDSKGEFIKVTDVENLLVSLCDNIGHAGTARWGTAQLPDWKGRRQST